MICFKYYNEKSNNILWQWDSNQWLSIVEGTLADDQFVHFCRGVAGTNVDILSLHPVNNKVQIPNQFLQRSGPFTVYAYEVNENGEKTLCQSFLSVKSRPQPPEYIIDPTPVITYPELIDLVNDLRQLSADLHELKPEMVTLTEELQRLEQELPSIIDQRIDEVKAAVNGMVHLTVGYIFEPETSVTVKFDGDLICYRTIMDNEEVITDVSFSDHACTFSCAQAPNSLLSCAVISIVEVI